MTEKHFHNVAASRASLSQKLEKKKLCSISFLLAPGRSLRNAFRLFKNRETNPSLYPSPSKGYPVPVRAAVVLSRRRRHQHDLQRSSAQAPRCAVARRSLREIAARERRRRRDRGDGSQSWSRRRDLLVLVVLVGLARRGRKLPAGTVLFVSVVRRKRERRPRPAIP